MVTPRAVATIVIFILSIVFVVQRVKIPLGRGRYILLDLLTAPIIAILILWASQCLGSSTIHHAIVGTDGVKPYNILILFFSLAYMSITLDETGVLKAAAHWVSNVSGKSATRLYINFYVMMTVLSAILGNDPVILSGTLFLLYYTEAIDLNPLPWLMTEFAAANTASMILFVGNPTNVVVCEGFGIENATFTAFMILPFLGCSLTCLLALFLQFRLSGHLHPELPTVEKFKIADDITDRVSAIVGGVLLFGCLVAAHTVGFVNVDVWKVTLPFATAKLIFDVAWGFYGRKKRDEEQKKTQQELANSMVSDTTMVPNGTQPDVQQGLPLEEHPASIDSIPPKMASGATPLNQRYKGYLQNGSRWFQLNQPILYAAFPRLPFALVPFAFSQFILIEALARQGWISIFARWLVIASGGRMFAVVWVVGIIGVLLCNFAGTNIGATILLTKVVHAAGLPPHTTRAAGIALALASNIGAVNFVFSASLAGLLWKGIIDSKRVDGRKKVKITQRTFAKWNFIPLLVMTSVGLAVVSAEVAVLYRRHH